MAARRKTDTEAAWVTVAYKHLPGHLTWPGFCRLMNWPGHVPGHARKNDDMRLSHYVKAARALGGEPHAFVHAVLDEMESRKQPKMEG